MKSIILTPMKKVVSVLRHVFVDGNANSVELAQVYVPMVIIIIAVILLFGHAPVK